MKKLIFALLLITYFQVADAQDTTQRVIAGRSNSIAQQQKPYVMLISIDGFRWDLADKFQAKNLLALKSKGVHAKYLESSFPSLTFPNHYTIATGLYPSHHGLVDNTFYDRKKEVIFRRADPKMALDSSFYGGKPLWVLAEEQKMLSAVFYWPGSEVSINGIKPTYLYPYNEVIPIDQRLVIVKSWLKLPAEKRPHFVALYFPQVDKASHHYGADAQQTAEAVKVVDEAVGKLIAIAEETGLPINFIVLSDHGMTTIDRENTLNLPKSIDRNNFKIPAGNAVLQIYAKGQTIHDTYRALQKEAIGYKVYLKDKTPKAWHFRQKDDHYNRIGDLILIPTAPKIFSINGIKPDLGQHGFDPKHKDMRGIFYAAGPNFKTELQVAPFENIHIYPLVAHILGLSYAHPIDGKEKTVLHILK